MLLLTVADLLKDSSAVSDGHPDLNKSHTFIELFFALNFCGKFCYVIHYCSARKYEYLLTPYDCKLGTS